MARRKRKSSSLIVEPERAVLGCRSVFGLNSRSLIRQSCISGRSRLCFCNCSRHVRTVVGIGLATRGAGYVVNRLICSIVLESIMVNAMISLKKYLEVGRQIEGLDRDVLEEMQRKQFLN